jgi:hypothetical protein
MKISKFLLRYALASGLAFSSVQVFAATLNVYCFEAGTQTDFTFKAPVNSAMKINPGKIQITFEKEGRDDLYILEGKVTKATAQSSNNYVQGILEINPTSIVCIENCSGFDQIKNQVQFRKLKFVSQQDQGVMETNSGAIEVVCMSNIK